MPIPGSSALGCLRDGVAVVGVMTNVLGANISWGWCGSSGV